MPRHPGTRLQDPSVPRLRVDIPTYADWLLSTDLESAYRYERRVLKLLSWGMPNKPWHLKTPVHALYIPSILAAFPEARFVMTHRDPTDVHAVGRRSVFREVGRQLQRRRRLATTSAS